MGNGCCGDDTRLFFAKSTVSGVWWSISWLTSELQRIIRLGYSLCFRFFPLPDFWRSVCSLFLSFIV
jgi:hypothetical protein